MGVQSSSDSDLGMGFEGEKVVESAADFVFEEEECVNSVSVQEAARSPGGRQALAGYMMLNRALHLSTEESALQDGSASCSASVKVGDDVAEEQESKKADA